jgi:hypothetical protein
LAVSLNEELKNTIHFGLLKNTQNVLNPKLEDPDKAKGELG